MGSLHRVEPKMDPDASPGDRRFETLVLGKLWLHRDEVHPLVQHVVALRCK